MSSDHYFSSAPASEMRPRRITAVLADREIELNTASGVFSPERIDAGTAVLLKHAPRLAVTGDLLDLGCGWGPIAITMGIQSPAATVWAVDVNERALDLVRTNAAELRIPNVTVATPERVPEEIRFTRIWSNPPIRVGKAQLHEMLLRWLPRLAPGGDAWLVVARNLGADSLEKWLRTNLDDGWDVTREATEKGYRVLRVHETTSLDEASRLASN